MFFRILSEKNTNVGKNQQIRKYPWNFFFLNIWRNFSTNSFVAIKRKFSFSMSKVLCKDSRIFKFHPLTNLIKILKYDFERMLSKAIYLSIVNFLSWGLEGLIFKVKQMSSKNSIVEILNMKKIKKTDIIHYFSLFS